MIARKTLGLAGCLLLLCTGLLRGQEGFRVAEERCGTMQVLEQALKGSPKLKQQFEAERTRFNNALRTGAYRSAAASSPSSANRGAAITIPVVFHVVLASNMQAQVTDAQILAQMDTLNKDYAGLNGDSVRIPPYFKSLFGKSALQFCLASQTPTGEPTSGIERTVTNKSSFGTDNAVKHVSTGGADAWDPNSYMNVWVCVLSGGILGYATFPNVGNDNEQGEVIEYRSLPGSALANFNGGKTLSHETGHYFNLYHIWGDDNGACTGTDFVDDTPNQGNSSTTCQTGIVLDNCTTSGNGIMYENYMDYTYDNCLVMFTLQQVARMESAFTAYRSYLLNSVGCQPPVLYNLDAQLFAVVQPGQRVCTSPFQPIVTIRNRGIQTLTSLTITTLLDGVSSSTFGWSGSLAQLASVNITLSPLNITPGNHVLKISLSAPNNGTDQNPVNDTATLSFIYNAPVTNVSEGFEQSVFPPSGWDIVNPDKGITWQRVTGVAKTGNASVMINNHENSSVGQQDYLRLPQANLKGADSAFVSFQVAAAAFSDLNTPNNNWDTLELLISTDCGQNYTSLYKKWGTSLVTHTNPVTSAFVPASSEWRKDSVDLSKYVDSGNILIAFRNTSGFENNIYLDDINLNTVTVNANLKNSGFLVTPSPTSGQVMVQFYPQPKDVKGIQIFSMSGQKVAETTVTSQSNYYLLDISHSASGIYVVRVVREKDVLIRRIVKY